LRDLLDVLQADQVFLDNPSETLPLPSEPMPAARLEEWLRKIAELEELSEGFSGSIRAEFLERKWMQAMEVIAPL
jgi:hypothetical protein